MDLSDLGELIADAAPLLGKLLPIPGAGIAGELIAAKFGTKNDPDAIAAAIKADPNAAMKLAEIESNNQVAIEGQLIAAETARILAVNATMSKEIESEDWFVKRARPFLLWSIGVSVILEIITGALVIWTSASIGDFVLLCQAMAIPQATAAAVCGVYMKQRSNDKALAAGHAPGSGLLGAVMDKFARS